MLRSIQRHRLLGHRELPPDLPGDLNIADILLYRVFILERKPSSATWGSYP